MILKKLLIIIINNYLRIIIYKGQNYALFLIILNIWKRLYFKK